MSFIDLDAQARDEDDEAWDEEEFDDMEDDREHHCIECGDTRYMGDPGDDDADYRHPHC